MEIQQAKLVRLIQLIDDFDTFGKLKRDMSLFSVAIGTLRKDKSLAADIIRVTNEDSDGLGAMALTRILIEDYLHLMFLNQNQADLTQNIENFNAHPHMQHYASLQAMKEWGFPLESKEAKELIESVNAGFQAHKDKFLRHKNPKEPFDPDDYYRTWTKTSLGKLVKKSGLTDSEADKKSLKFLTETYDTASSIIHHDSFIIWFLASQDKNFLSEQYPDLALTISVIALSRIVNVVLQISQPVIDDDTLYLQHLNKLGDIL